MDKTFIEKLTKIREKYNSKDFTTLEKELNEYKSIIPDFFSRSGEGAGIRSMYEKVNDKECKNNVNTVDLNITESVYDDYLNGMYTFVQDLNTAVIRESDVSNYETKLNTAITNDPIFMESIFGGTLNPVSECTIKEASQNLEVLIDFIPKIDTFFNKSKILSESMKGDNDLVGKSIEMVCESVGNYTYNVIKNIMTTYYDIMESFEEKPQDEKKIEYNLF